MISGDWSVIPARRRSKKTDEFLRGQSLYACEKSIDINETFLYLRGREFQRRIYMRRSILSWELNAGPRNKCENCPGIDYIFVLRQVSRLENCSSIVTNDIMKMRQFGTDYEHTYFESRYPSFWNSSRWPVGATRLKNWGSFRPRVRENCYSFFTLSSCFC